MEEERKAEPWGLRNRLSINKDKGPTNEPESSTSQKQEGGFEIDRYQYDMEQAQQMRKGMEKKRKGLTEADILLGLNGLDEADRMRESGDFEPALKMSEMAMELLLQFLKSESSLLPSIRRDSISSRVQAALTDAEEMKRDLNSRQQISPSSSKSQSPTKKSFKTTAQALSEALAGAAKKISNSNSSKPKQTAGQSTASQPSVSSPQNSVSPTSRISSTHSSSPRQQSPPQGNRQVSQFYKSQDPLVQTIKSELYVDQSQLQEISWDDIAGLETAKQSLQENAILPMLRPDLFTGLRKPRNILLYGPPGTGKTMLVKAVAKESQCLLFICTASSLTSKWHGEGEKLLRTLFQVARAAAPSIIFVDEMDALLSSRKSDGEHEASRRFKTEFMTQVDGIVKDGGTNVDGKHLLLIACTNCPWDIDSAVLRRFPRRIYIPLPDTSARKALLEKLLLKAGKHQLKSSDIKSVAKRLHGFSGSDIASIASEASFGPLRSLGGLDAIRGATASEIRPILAQDFDTAINQSTKSVSKKALQKYDEWKQDQAAS
jgi:SpoVK/Ycf46/Vps4 family AAA+-type ATPase